MTSQTVANAMLALAEGLSEAFGDEAAHKAVNYLIATADGPGVDAATSELIWNLIEAMTPPQLTPHNFLGAFA